MSPTFVHLDMVKRTLRAPFQVAAQVRLRCAAQPLPLLHALRGWGDNLHSSLIRPFAGQQPRVQ